MSSYLDLDLLRCFVMVADTGTLSRAAERVGRSQAAVSMQMRRLESILERPLLNRTGRGVVMTVHGERLLTHARRILRSHDEAMAELSGRSLVGTLRFGCPDFYANAFLPALLQKFAQQHPHARIEVVCAPSPRLLGQLNRNVIDLALVSTADEAAPGVLRIEELVWVVHENAKGWQSVPLRLALGDPDTLDYTAAVSTLETAKRAYEIAYSSGSLSGLLAVVRSGQAIAVLTRATVPPDFRILSTDNGLPRLPRIGLMLQMDEKQASHLTRAFEAHVRTWLPLL
ncbi:LysR family transcriptional regulator [Phyllobacterium myrsinacearum]|uniref:LysR family transcriptional regulator n=1 Tax=Phyllobacterium myrsinacearum TaxID=28101 RepID=UPI001028F06F|nr:LysR family transcriptional regulator [Phyllobacterium myrsinacearum]RZS76854.1 LysR family transcriptional regulator [Phyllobacterium myrsinacearum]